MFLKSDAEDKNAALQKEERKWRTSMSETAKCRKRLKRFIKGYGIDIGYGGDPIVEWAITVDLPTPYTKVGTHPLNLGGDARDLYWFRDEVLDFVYSSHLLEDFENTKEVLTEWLRVLKVGGHLILYCPVEQVYREHCRKTGQPYNYAHKIENFDLNYVKNILEQIGVTEIIHAKPLVDDYSFELVARKIKSLNISPVDRYQRKIKILERLIQEKEDRINALLSSNSWKITAPLRWAKRFLKKNLRFAKNFLNLRRELLTSLLTLKEIKRAAFLLRIKAPENERDFLKDIEKPLYNLPDTDFICAMYKILLYRDPDDEGLQAYVNDLKEGISRFEILKRMKSSEEYSLKVNYVPFVDDTIPDWHVAVGGHEQELIDLFKLNVNLDSIFVDVGAHVGTWTLQLYPFFQHVVAFEPNPAAYESLKANLKMNDIKNVTVVKMALWNKPIGKMKMSIYASPSHSTLLPVHPIPEDTGERLGEIEVDTTSIDDYLTAHWDNGKIGLIKIDTEGAEVQVIKGALRTLKKHKPAIVIEIHRPEDERVIIQLLKKSGITKINTKIWNGQKYLLHLQDQN